MMPQRKEPDIDIETVGKNGRREEKPPKQTEKLKGNMRRSTNEKASERL